MGWTGRHERLARILVTATTWLAIVATLAVVETLVTGDFSAAYVAKTTSRSTPLVYRVAGLWGGMEGSILFYATLVLGVGVVSTRRLTTDLRSVATPVAATAGTGLLILTAAAASPFRRLAIPAVDGDGLFAILQHPAMVYHPPLLYLGLTSLVAPFALTISAVVRRRTDTTWLWLARRWMLRSWVLLTIGIVTGANWAYIELGWGGFWAWDPVENTSLMPWIAITIFLHTSRIQRRNGGLTRWNVAMALAPFTLTVLGVYLTRSGVTGSIHSFAESRTVGRVLLFAFAAVGLASAFAAWHAPPGAETSSALPRGRAGWLTFNAALLTVALVVVLVGSAYPAVLQVFFDTGAILRPRFFLILLVPVAFLLIVGMALSLSGRWRPSPVARTRLVGLVVAVGAGGFVAPWLSVGENPVGSALFAFGFGGLALGLFDTAVRRPRGRMLGAHLAHIGFIMVLMGAAASSLGGDVTASMTPGDQLEIGPYRLALNQISTGDGDRFIFVSADFEIYRDAERIGDLRPEIRAYEQQSLPVAEPALRSGLSSDLIVAISGVSRDASTVTVDVFMRPLVVWVWAGAVVMAAAGVISLLSKDGGAEGRRRWETAMQPSEETATGS